MKKIAQRCKAGVYLRINEHKDRYKSAFDYIEELRAIGAIEDEDDVEEEILNIMIKTDSIVELTFYPETPIGSYTVYHYDVDLAIEQAHKILNL